VIKRETVAYDIKYVDSFDSLRVQTRHFNLEEAIVSAKKAVKNSENQEQDKFTSTCFNENPPV
jgi:hypothetical protein